MPRLPSASTVNSGLYRFCVAGALILWSLPAATAQIPDVHRLEYTGFSTSGEATVSVHGERLQNAAWLWTESGLLAPAPNHDAKSDKTVTFHGSVTGGEGLVAARVITESGCSQSLLIVADSSPATTAAPMSESAATPQELSLPSAVQGVIQPVRPRFFRMALTAGTTVEIQVFARRVNSDLDPVLTVRGPDGSEVAFCDDTPGLEGDAELTLQAAQDGNYTIALRDVAYQGGGRHYFYLRVATTPLDSGHGSKVPCLTDRCLVEQEPNNDASTASALGTEHHRLQGTLGQPGDVDWYRLQVDQETPLCVCSSRQTLSGPVDLVLRLHDADGRLLQENDESEIADASICTRLQPGTYLLSVSDLGLRGGTGWNYTLSVERSGRVEAHVSAEQVVVPQGGSASLATRIVRREYQGPLQVSITGLPEGIHCPPLLLHGKQSTLPLTFTAAAAFRNSGCRDWALSRVNVSSENATPLHVITVVAPRPRKKQDGPYRTQHRTPDFFCAGGPAAEFSITAAQSEVALTSGSTAMIPLQAVRHKDWGMPVDVALAVPAAELPDGVTVNAVKLEGDQGSITVTASAEAQPGAFTLFLQGSAKKEKTTATHPLPPILVRIGAAASEAQVEPVTQG